MLILGSLPTHAVILILFEINHRLVIVCPKVIDVIWWCFSKIKRLHYCVTLERDLTAKKNCVKEKYKEKLKVSTSYCQILSQMIFCSTQHNNQHSRNISESMVLWVLHVKLYVEYRWVYMIIHVITGSLDKIRGTSCREIVVLVLRGNLYLFGVHFHRCAVISQTWTINLEKSLVFI